MRTVTEKELRGLLAAHARWLKDVSTGERADLSRADLSGADLRGANLSGAHLSRANLSQADLSRADLSEANLREADLSRATLSGAHLSGANLSGADLSEANLREAHLSRANLSQADLSRADLSEADLSGADLSEADLREAHLSRATLSGATGLIDPVEYLSTHFECTAEGLLAYKTFGANFAPPARWSIEPGQVLTEVVSPDRANDCGCGINVATLDWVRQNSREWRPIWRCLIRWPWLAGVVVPFHTSGKIRAGRVELVDIVSIVSEEE